MQLPDTNTGVLVNHENMVKSKIRYILSCETISVNNHETTNRRKGQFRSRRSGGVSINILGGKEGEIHHFRPICKAKCLFLVSRNIWGGGGGNRKITSGEFPLLSLVQSRWRNVEMKNLFVSLHPTLSSSWFSVLVLVYVVLCECIRLSITRAIKR